MLIKIFCCKYKGEDEKYNSDNDNDYINKNVNVNINECENRKDILNSSFNNFYNPLIAEHKKKISDNVFENTTEKIDINEWEVVVRNTNE